MRHTKRIISAVLITTLLMSILGMTAVATSSDYTIKSGVLTGYTGSEVNLVIPDNLGITSIDMYAFSNCQTLNSVTIPANVSAVDSRAFAWCRALSSIAVAPGNTSYISVGGVLFTKDKTALVAYPCGKTGAYVIPGGVKQILTMAFTGCEGLSAVTIPEGVTTIGGSAFSGCSALTSLAIPASVTDIQLDAFSSCRALTELTVASKNSLYSSADGVLFSKDQTSLVSFPSGKAGNYNIPSGVKTIAAAAFINCDLLTGVKIPLGITKIGDLAFSGCTIMTKIVIPSSVTEIGYNAFSGCVNLTIYGTLGTTAETYAKANSLSFETMAVTATPTAASVLVNGVAVKFEAYNINGNNYFKLRDLAKAVTGTDRQFEVGWNADKFAISLTTGKSYTSVGGELTAPSKTASVTALFSTASVYMNGVEISLKAYNINDNNYFKLRDVAEAIDFGVTWNAEKSTIAIDTTQGYMFE